MAHLVVAIVSGTFALIFLLRGSIPLRGTSVSRQSDPSTFRFVIGFLLTIALLFLSQWLFPGWQIEMLEDAGILLPAGRRP